MPEVYDDTLTHASPNWAFAKNKILGAALDIEASALAYDAKQTVQRGALSKSAATLREVANNLESMAKGMPLIEQYAAMLKKADAAAGATAKLREMENTQRQWRVASLKAAQGLLANEVKGLNYFLEQEPQAPAEAKSKITEAKSLINDAMDFLAADEPQRTK